MIVRVLLSRVVATALGVAAGVVTAACPAPYYDDDIGLDGVPTTAGVLAGRFALQSTAVDQAEVAIFGKIDTGGITASLVTRTWRGGDEPDAYDEAIEVCGVENFETAGLTTVNTPATIRSIPTSQAVLRVDHATGAFTREPYREYWAVRDLDDDDALPTNKDSSVYYDMDDDGNPGTTVQASGLVNGEVYVAQRKTVDQRGVVRGDDESVGLSRVKKEGLILEATNDLLKTEAPRLPHPDPKQSWWMEVRLRDDDGCRAVLDAQESGELPRIAPFPEE
jgi:hypothetical protein